MQKLSRTLLSKSWDGNTSDTQIFQERAAALLTAFAHAPTPRYLVADAKLYNEANAPTLAKLGFITRIPGTLKLVAQVITQALTSDLWKRRLFAIIWAESKSLHNRLISFFSGCVHFAIQRPGVESA